jgi:hypothetical protein
MFGSPKLKTMIAIAITSAGISYSSNSSAIISFTDYAALVENSAGNIQDMYNWAQEKALTMMEMELTSTLEGLSIDNMNNAIANVISRTGAATQEVQNLEVLEKSAPDKDACATITLQILGKDAECATAEKSSQAIKKAQAKHANYSSGGSAYKDETKKLVEKVVQDCEVLQDPSLEMNDENLLASSMCADSGLLTGVTLDGDTLNPDQEKAAALYIDLVTGVEPTFKKSSLLQDDSASYNKMLVSEMRRESFRSIVITSLNEIKAMRTSPGIDSEADPSPMQLLQEFDDDRFGDADWMAELQNVKASSKNSIYPSEINRKIAVMDAFSVHLDLLQYKQSLRMEALINGLLALEVDPLD